MAQPHKLLPLIFLVLVMIAPLACSDAKPSASLPQYESALQRAKEDGKPILLYFFSKYCHYCTLMEQETLADKEIGGILDGFHVVRIDADRNVGLARRYSVVGYPSCWFLEGSGKRIVGIPGYMQKPLFKKILEYVKGNYYKTKDIQKHLRKAS